MTTNFGRELSCTDSIKTGRYVTGARVVAEAMYRRLITPRGMLRGGDDEAHYGLDLTEYIGQISNDSSAKALAGQVKGELLKDERLESVTVVVTPTVDGPSSTFVVAIDGETADGPFSLQVGVDDVSASLLGITP